jgi:hypothetical protein
VESGVIMDLAMRGAYSCHAAMDFHAQDPIRA